MISDDLVAHLTRARSGQRPVASRTQQHRSDGVGIGLQLGYPVRPFELFFCVRNLVIARVFGSGKTGVVPEWSGRCAAAADRWGALAFGVATGGANMAAPRGNACFAAARGPRRGIVRIG